MDLIADEPVLKSYHHLQAVRGDLLQKLGRITEARLSFEAAARLATNARERAMMGRRAAAMADLDGAA